MTSYGYPFRELAPDYARAAAGFAVTAGPLPWLTDSPVALTILGALAFAFAVYGLSLYLRQRTVVTADATAIESIGLRRVTVPWDALEGLDLRYYSTRRDRQRGWMQLRLTGGGRRLAIDSALDGFIEVTKRAAAAAAANHLDLNDATRANLHALGIAGAGPREGRR